MHKNVVLWDCFPCFALTCLATQQAPHIIFIRYHVRNKLLIFCICLHRKKRQYTAERDSAPINGRSARGREVTLR